LNTTYIVCGSPGAGKSSYAVQLVSKQHAVLLDIDTATERLVKVSMKESGHSSNDRDSEYFKQTFREPIYETLFDIAKENLYFTDVVIVGPFTKELRITDWPAKLANNLECKIEVHYVYCFPEIRRSRIEKRANLRDLAKLREWKESSQYYGDESPPVFKHVYIDNSDFQKGHEPGNASISPTPSVKIQKP